MLGYTLRAKWIVIPFVMGWVVVGVSAGELEVGLAMVDITPPTGWRLYGDYRERYATGVHDPLYAKAITFKEGGTEAALVVCDLTGISREATARMRELVVAQTHIPAENLVLSATHTHGAPSYFDYMEVFFGARMKERKGRDDGAPFDYSEFLAQRAAKAIATARERRTAVSLESGIAKVEGLAFNRRFHMKNGTVRFNPGKMNPDIVGPAGPVDPDFHMLFFRSKGERKPVGSLSVFAMHVATFGGSEFGADFPMHLHERLKEKYGEGFISIFGEGTAGNTNHINVKSPEPQTSDKEPARIGGLLADVFTKSEKDFKLSQSTSLAVRSRVVPIPLQETTEDQIERAKDMIGREGDQFPDFYVLVESNRIMDIHLTRQKFGDDLPMQVQVIRLSSEAAIVCLPHEIFVEFGMAIKAASPFPNTMVVSLCNDVDFYVPTRKAFAEGAYEVINSRIKPGGGEKLVESAIELLKELTPR